MLCLLATVSVALAPLSSNLPSHKQDTKEKKQIRLNQLTRPPSS